MCALANASAATYLLSDRILLDRLKLCLAGRHHHHHHHHQQVPWGKRAQLISSPPRAPVKPATATTTVAVLHSFTALLPTQPTSTHTVVCVGVRECPVIRKAGDVNLGYTRTALGNYLRSCVGILYLSKWAPLLRLHWYRSTTLSALIGGQHHLFSKSKTHIVQ